MKLMIILLSSKIHTLLHLQAFCQTCYGLNKLIYCSDAYGIKMFTTTLTGQKFPLVKNMTIQDVICTSKHLMQKPLQKMFYLKIFFIQITLFLIVRKCLCLKGIMELLMQSQSQEYTMYQLLAQIFGGWFGGCGQMNCTGPNNYYIFDQDGFFTGNKSQLLANNSMIVNNQSFCTFIPQINGHRCFTDQLGVLQYESLAPDSHTRTLWPSYLKYDCGLWRIIYSIPNCIELLVKNNTGKNILVKPYPIKSGISTDLKTRTSICGGNNFYYQNGTIQFIINGNRNFQVRIRVTSFVQLRTRIEIPLSEFYTNEGKGRLYQFNNCIISRY